jgi:hypothetical protein
MAAGKFFMYNSALRYVLQGQLDLDTGPIWLAAVQSGYTPDTAGHSILSQVCPTYQATANSALVPFKQCTGLTVTSSGVVAIKYDIADINGISAGGYSTKMKYGVFFASASAGGLDNLLLGFVNMDTGGTTGVEGVQINLVINSAGLFKINTNQ